MAHPIQAVRTVYDVVKCAKDNNNPISDDEIQQLLLKLVPDESIRKRFKDFSNGYAAEELFRRIFSLLPWIKLITPLGQEQFPEKSKSDLQVPDYEILFEAGSKGLTSKLLIEAKLITNDKQTFCIQKYKYNVLRKYELESGIPLVFAIFWRTRMIWTLNVIETFQKKSSEYKITFKQACMNDLSAILGDYTYIFENKIYRKSKFFSNQETKTDYPHSHGIYGKTAYEGLSTNGTTYTDLSIWEPAVLDCAFDFETLEVKNEVDPLELIEELVKTPYVYKLSSLILAFLEKIYMYDNDDMSYKQNLIINEAFNIIDGLRQKAKCKRYYLLPHDKNFVHKNLVYVQFGKANHIYDCYLNAPRTNDNLLLCSHDQNPKFDYKA